MLRACWALSYADEGERRLHHRLDLSSKSCTMHSIWVQIMHSAAWERWRSLTHDRERMKYGAKPDKASDLVSLIAPSCQWWSFLAGATISPSYTPGKISATILIFINHHHHHHSNACSAFWTHQPNPAHEGTHGGAFATSLERDAAHIAVSSNICMWLIPRERCHCRVLKYLYVAIDSQHWLWIMEYLMVILPHWLPYCPVEAGIFESEFRIAWKLMWTYFPERDAHASLSSQTSRVVLKCDASRHEQVAYAHEHTLTSLSLKPAGSLLYAWHTVCGGRKSSILWTEVDLGRQTSTLVPRPSRNA